MVPAGIDTGIPHPARAFDYWLGGKDNYEPDREMAEQVIAIAPEMPRTVRGSRAFLQRAVRSLAEAGIRQFIDVGSGLPTMENTHEVAQLAAPGTRVAYIDNDPAVVAHANALLAGTDAGPARIIQADLRQTDAMLAHPDLRALIDLGQPVAVLLVAVLHFITDDEDPYGAVALLRDAIAPGSYLVLAHLTGDADPSRGEYAVQAWQHARTTPAPILRDREQVGRFLDGLDLLDPGIVPVDHWRPEVPPSIGSFWLYGGVGRKR
jgi:O-methyltransferase involved in polyketide biosynthesis